MKNFSFPRYFSGVLCAAGVALGGVFCPISAFAVPVDAPLLTWLCLGFALLLPLPLCTKHRGRWFLGALLPALLWLYAGWENVKNGLLLTAEAVFWHYGRAFELFSGIETVRFGLPAEATATAFFALLGGALALTAAWTATGNGPLLPLAAVSAPPLVLCLMVVNTVPAPWALLPLAGAWALLLLSQSLRRRDPEAGHRLLLRLALPTAALMLLLCLAVKPGDYARPAWPDALQEKIQAAVDRVGELFTGQEESGGAVQTLFSSYGPDTLGLFGWNSELQRTDLSSVGPQSTSGRRVMEVLFSKSGRYYLRGNSLAVYDGESWSALPESAYRGLSVRESDWLASGGDSGEARIKTDKRASIYYLPYTPTALPDGAALYYDAYVRNTGYVKDYTVSFADGESGFPYEDFVCENYLQVPRSTRNALEPVLEDLEERLAAASYTDADLVAGVVADYVRSSAVYDLETARMPRGEDFVSWFLLESDTGYCVHFASAAAILLRCEGVPARYVSGYVVSARAGDWTAVLSDDAHAWVEYYVAGEGWKTLEATPAGLSQPEPTPVPGAEETAPPRETPVQTTPPTGETPAPDAPAADRPGGGGGENGTTRNGIHIPGWLWLVLAVAPVPVLWRAGIRALRRRAFRKGTPSRRAVACYHSIRRLSRFTGAAVPRFAREAAEKARFSRSGVSEAELQRLLDYLDTLRAAAKADKDPLRWLLYRVVFAL